MANPFILDIHSILRWVIVLMGGFVLINSFIGWKSKKAYSSQDNATNMIFISLCDIQLLIGFVLYFTSPLGSSLFSQLGMKEVMGNGVYRFFALEHLVGMILAIVLFHVARAKSKKKLANVDKHKAVFVWTLIGFIIMFATIPWPFRELFASRGWF